MKSILDILWRFDVALLKELLDNLMLNVCHLDSVYVFLFFSFLQTFFRRLQVSNPEEPYQLNKNLKLQAIANTFGHIYNVHKVSIAFNGDKSNTISIQENK